MFLCLHGPVTVRFSDHLLDVDSMVTTPAVPMFLTKPQVTQSSAMDLGPLALHRLTH